MASRGSVKQPIQSIFPTFSLREVAILLALIRFGMQEGCRIDGEEVKADEWKNILRQLLRH